MQGKIWGILLSILGITGLIWALLYISGPKEASNLPLLLAAGVCGALAFFIGIWLVDHQHSGKKVTQARPGMSGRREHSTIAA